MSLLGQQIGHFRVIDLLGKGRMGDVYAGYDERLDRRVALKLIRREHRLNDEVKARMRREARVLAQLDHPNICRLYDLVEELGHDVLVLELIQGESLKKAMRRNRSLGERLRIAEQIAAALQAAHEHGVVHRDLKPENVMLTHEGVVRVLDFGLARSLDAELATMTLHAEEGESGEAVWRGTLGDEGSNVETRHGSIMGTAAYMSPEQAAGQPATMASDVYSFGLILQELFTGRPPYSGDVEVSRLLRLAARGETLPVEGIDPEIAALIRRTKSLAPALRPSAVDVGERLRAVRDRPRRRRRQIALAASIVFLVAVAVVMTVLALRISREADRANREADRANREAAAAEEVADFLVDLFEVSNPGEARGNSVTAREILDAGAARIRDELAEQPWTQARLMATIGIVYRQLGLFEEARPLLSESLELRQQELGAEHLDVALSLTELAYLDWRQGRLEDAEDRYLRAIQINEAGDADEAELARSLNGLGIIYWNQGRFDEAEPLYRRALELREAAYGPRHRDVASSLDNLAIVLKDSDREAEAEPLYRRAVEIREAVLGVDHPEVATGLNNLGALYLQLERYEEAEPLYERAIGIWRATLGDRHPAVGVGTVNLASVEHGLGDAAASEEHYIQAIANLTESVGPEHPYSAYAEAGLGELYLEIGRHAEAVPLFERALTVFRQMGSDHPEVGHTLRKLADAHQGAGDLVAAARYRAEALEALTRALGADHADVAELRQRVDSG